MVVSEVLEHLTNEIMRLALAEIRRVLVPDGEIIGTVPCEENLGDGMVICPHCGEIFHKVGHCQSFSSRTMARELERYFERVECFERAFMAKSEVGWKEQTVDLVRNFLASVIEYCFESHDGFVARTGGAASRISALTLFPPRIVFLSCRFRRHGVYPAIRRRPL